MVMGRDFELEPESVRARLVVVDYANYREFPGVSKATFYLRNNGDLVLYCADSGLAVMMQMGEDVQEWRRWYTVAAGDVGRLGITGPAPDMEDRVVAVYLLAGLRDVLDVRLEKSAATVEGAFISWLRGRGVPYESREHELREN
jgi:hypothetical protein